MVTTAKPRVGLYAWEGPNTIELLNTKYHSPKINEESFARLYKRAFLEEAQDKIGLTDLWMTYSWGFSDERESPQHAYVREHLPHIKKMGLITYGYVQGLNVVGEDFKDEDFFCRSVTGAKISYSKDRYLICPSHPDTHTHLTQRVRNAVAEGFDAVFVDNIIFGFLPAIVGSNAMSSFGCHCAHCQNAFSDMCGYNLPVRVEEEQMLKDVIAFRVHQTKALVAVLSDSARSSGAQFGVNLFDPFWHTPELYFGYSFEALRPYLDYYLIENHTIAHGTHTAENGHLKALRGDGKPVFVLSYRNGIGCEEMYSHETLQSIFDDASKSGLSPCVKGSEFTTNGVWHTFDIDAVGKVTQHACEEHCLPDTTRSLVSSVAPKLPRRGIFMRMYIRLVDRFLPRCYTALYQSRVLWALFVRSGFYTRALRKRRFFDIDSYTV